MCVPKKLGDLGALCIPAQNSVLLAKFLTKLRLAGLASFAGWTGSQDLGDCHYFDILTWKDFIVGLNHSDWSPSLLSGMIYLKDPHHDRFPNLFSCSEDEDTDHLLFWCSRAWKVWNFFHKEFYPQGYASFTDNWLSRTTTSMRNLC
jgi:hypothetical protein